MSAEEGSLQDAQIPFHAASGRVHTYLLDAGLLDRLHGYPAMDLAAGTITWTFTEAIADEHQVNANAAVSDLGVSILFVTVDPGVLAAEAAIDSLIEPLKAAVLPAVDGWTFDISDGQITVLWGSADSQVADDGGFDVAHPALAAKMQELAGQGIAVAFERTDTWPSVAVGTVPYTRSAAQQGVALGDVIAAVFAQSSAAEAGSTTQDDSAVPEGVDLSEWDEISGSGILAVTPAFSFPSLEDLAVASELVIKGTVVEQHPYLDHDLVATESIVRVDDTLSGSSPELIRVYSLGAPNYVPGAGDIDGSGPPPTFGETYVFFLYAPGQLTDAESNLVPTENLWIANGMGQYLLSSDGEHLRWDGDGASPTDDGSPPLETTVTEVLTVLEGIATSDPVT